MAVSADCWATVALAAARRACVEGSCVCQCVADQEVGNFNGVHEFDVERVCVGLQMRINQASRSAHVFEDLPQALQSVLDWPPPAARRHAATEGMRKERGRGRGREGGREGERNRESPNRS